jgi:hypothetical protein
MQVRGFFGEGQIIAPPRVEVPALPATGFVVCPLALQSIFLSDRGFQEIYQLAYERALAAVRPSWYERLSVATRN